MAVTLSNNFGLVVISCALIAIQVLLTGFLVVGRIRRRVFNKEFLAEFFAQEHYSYTNEDIEKTAGYPDMGCGRYAQKLSYPNWLQFNIAQRIHYNYVEHAASIIIVTLLGGWVFPIIAAVFGYVYVFGRCLYVCYLQEAGYKNFWRGLAAVICDVCFLGNFVLSILTAVQFLTDGKTF